jgi:hypothetical protein
MRVFRREASQSLVTYLCEPNDDRIDSMPLLRRAAEHWLSGLSERAHHCLICQCRVVSRDHVGALLLSTPDIAKPTSASTCAVCEACWTADLPVDALERAAESVLRSVVPNGKLEPLARR